MLHHSYIFFFQFYIEVESHGKRHCTKTNVNFQNGALLYFPYVRARNSSSVGVSNSFRPPAGRKYHDPGGTFQKDALTCIEYERECVGASQNFGSYTNEQITSDNISCLSYIVFFILHTQHIQENNTFIFFPLLSVVLFNANVTALGNWVDC